MSFFGTSVSDTTGTTVSITGTGCGTCVTATNGLTTSATAASITCTLASTVATAVCNVKVTSYGGSSITAASLTFAGVPTITSLTFTPLLCFTSSTSLVPSNCPISSVVATPTATILSIVGTNFFGASATPTTTVTLSGGVGCGGATTCNVATFATSQTVLYTCTLITVTGGIATTTNAGCSVTVIVMVVLVLPLLLILMLLYLLLLL